MKIKIKVSRTGLPYFLYILPVFLCFLCFSCTSATFITQKEDGFDFIPRWESLGDGIDAAFVKIKNPKLRFYCVRADLSGGFVKVKLNDAEGDFGTLFSIKTSTFAKKYDTAAAVNGSPFFPASSKEGEKLQIAGFFVSGGQVWHYPAPDSANYGALVFKKDGGAEIVGQSGIKNYQTIENAAGGFRIILKDGKFTGGGRASFRRQPRTAAGLNGSIFFMLVIDGRSFSSAGASEEETAFILSRLGAKDALNLDGGGSSVLVIKKDGRQVIANKPVHGLFRAAERAVAVCIGLVSTKK